MGAYVSVGANVVGITVAAILGFVFHLKGKGLLIGLAAGCFVRAAFFGLKLVSTNWEQQASKVRERIFEGDSQTRPS